MTNKQANFCCDCYYAKRTGFIFKTWRCTHPEVNKVKDWITGHNEEEEFSPVTARLPKKRKAREYIDCMEARHEFYTDIPMPWGGDTRRYHIKIEHCKHYKGNYRSHLAFPPIKNRLPIPPKETPCHKVPKSSQGRSQVASASD